MKSFLFLAAFAASTFVFSTPASADYCANSGGGGCAGSANRYNEQAAARSRASNGYSSYGFSFGYDYDDRVIYVPRKRKNRVSDLCYSRQWRNHRTASGQNLAQSRRAGAGRHDHPCLCGTRVRTKLRAVSALRHPRAPDRITRLGAFSLLVE